MVAISIVGGVTGVGWIIAGADLRIRERPRPPAPRPDLICWMDRRYGEMCAPADRPPPVRRHYARDFY
jgi:hypothetical protein